MSAQNDGDLALEIMRDKVAVYIFTFIRFDRTSKLVYAVTRNRPPEKKGSCSQVRYSPRASFLLPLHYPPTPHFNPSSKQTSPPSLPPSL